MRRNLAYGFVIIIAALLSLYTVSFADEPILERIEWSDIWITDADSDNLPRVLLVGDSIVRGYYAGVDKRLSGKAACARYTTSKFVGNPDYLDELLLILKRHHYDIIHFNNGLHGWGYTEEQYETGLRRLIEVLREHAGDAVLIWAASTPVRDRDDLSRMNEERTARVRERNRIAGGIMKDAGIAIDDLFGLVEKHPEYYSKDGTHFNDTGKELQAGQVAGIIGKYLPTRDSR